MTLGTLGLIGNIFYLATRREDSSLLIKVLTSSPSSFVFVNPGFFSHKRIHLTLDNEETLTYDIVEKNNFLFIDENTFKPILFATTTEEKKWGEIIQNSYCTSTHFKNRLALKNKITQFKIEYINTSNSTEFTRQYTCKL